jgi:hypothetical protein
VELLLGQRRCPQSAGGRKPECTVGLTPSTKCLKFPHASVPRRVHQAIRSRRSRPCVPVGSLLSRVRLTAPSRGRPASGPPLTSDVRQYGVAARSHTWFASSSHSVSMPLCLGNSVPSSVSAWAVRPSAASARSAAIQAVFWSAWSRVSSRGCLPSSPSKAWPKQPTRGRVPASQYFVESLSWSRPSPSVSRW